jgi:sugar phosphate isomerase/epimerase
VQGFDLPAPLGFTGLLQKARELNMGLIQVADNLPLDQLDGDSMINFYQNASDSGIQLEAGARGMTEPNLERYIGIAETIHSPLLRFVIDGPGFTPDMDTILGIIRNALPVLEEKKIVLALENYERIKARDFAEIIDRIGSNAVGICLDSVNSLGAGEGLETIVELLAPLTVNLHIKEFTISRMSHMMGFQIEGLPAGDGMLNVPWLLEKVSDRCQSAILELWTPPEKEMEDTIMKEDDWASKSISYLKNIVK